MTTQAYSFHARVLHWLTVVLLTGLIVVGLLLGTVKGSLGNTLYFYHKSFGMLLFLVVVWRLARRFLGGVPKPSQMITPLQVRVSEAVHWALYALLLAMPIAGYVLVGAFPAPLDFFGLQVPNILEKDRALSAQAANVHWAISIAMICLIAMHVGAALFHHFVKKDDVLQRMIPSLKRRT